MAMAFAPIAIVWPEGVRIAEAGVVSKSYPHFWKNLEQAGFQCVNERKTEQED
jgi:3-phosphoshikimate 1-carboxyvinyltransferase